MKYLSKIFKSFRNEKKEKGTNVFEFLLQYFNFSTPIYLIDKDFNLIWSNEEFKKTQKNNQGVKCYEALFNSEIICGNCPAVKSFAEQNLNDSIVKTSKKHHRTAATKIISQPFNFNGNKYLLNFVEKEYIEKEEALDKKIPQEIQDLLESINIPIAVVNLAFEIVKLNNPAKNLLKTDLNEKETKKLAELFVLKQEVNFDEILTNLLNNKPQSFIASLKSKNKEPEIFFACHLSKLQPTNELILLVFKPIKTIPLENPQIGERFEILEGIVENLPLGVQVQTDIENKLIENKQARQIVEVDKNLLNEVQKQFLALEKLSTKTFEYENELGKYKITIDKLQSKVSSIVYQLLLFENVTEKEKLQKDLNKYKNLLELTAKFVRVISFTIDSEYHIKNVLGKIDGIIADDVDKFQPGKVKFLELVFPEDSYKIVETLNELFHFPNISKEVDFRLQKPENEYLWVKGIFANEVDERGKIQNVKCILFDINEQKKVEEQLKASQEEMRNLALYFESLREEEKKKLAFEIHDELGHLLTAMKLEMSWILKKKYLREDVLHEKLIKLIEMVESTIKKVRSISSQLRPSILDHFGIVAAIEWQAKEFQRQTAIRCRINITKQDVQLDEAKSIVVFRVFQEILTNIARHANATRVDVTLEVEDNNLVLTVSDNGRGIKQEDMISKRSLGIAGMKERANSVNGKLTIQGVSNVGTTVTLTIPIN